MIQLLVVAAQTGRELVGKDVRDRFGAADDAVGVWVGQGADKGQETLLVGRCVVAGPAADGNNPTITLDGEEAAKPAFPGCFRRREQPTLESSKDLSLAYRQSKPSGH